MNRAWDREERERKAAREALSTIGASSQTLPKDSQPQTQPSKAPTSEPPGKQRETSPTS